MRAQQSASGLIIMVDSHPEVDYERSPTAGLRPQYGEFMCFTCDAEFMDQGEYERHCIECAERWEAELMAQSMRVRNPVLFDRSRSDVREWLDKDDNAQKVLEGRKKL